MYSPQDLLLAVFTAQKKQLICDGAHDFRLICFNRVATRSSEKPQTNVATNKFLG